MGANSKGDGETGSHRVLRKKSVTGKAGMRKRTRKKKSVVRQTKTKSFIALWQTRRRQPKKKRKVMLQRGNAPYYQITEARAPHGKKISRLKKKKPWVADIIASKGD